MRHKPSHRKTQLRLEPQEWRLPDRGKKYFGRGRAVSTELQPEGRPSDIYGDVKITLARVRALEGPQNSD